MQSTSARIEMAASTFPPPPVNTIDWANVGFKVREGEKKPGDETGGN